jgi:hypothetical protein
MARRGRAVSIARPVTRGWPRVRVAFVPSAGSRVAAGVTWTSRTTSAPWAARFWHTSVIDAAGAIYVIGGSCSSSTGWTYYQDVWESTNGGA